MALCNAIIWHYTKALRACSWIHIGWYCRWKIELRESLRLFFFFLNIGLLTIVGGLSFIFVHLFVPETLRSLVGNGSGYASPAPFQKLACRRGQLDEEENAQIKAANGLRRPMNFLAPLIYLTEPDVAVALTFSGFLHCSMYTFMTSTTNQLAIHCNLTELQIGL